MNWQRPGLRIGLVVAIILVWTALSYATRNDPSETETAQAIADDAKAAAMAECKRLHGRRWCERRQTKEASQP